mgnify:CR=1 FL=1
MGLLYGIIELMDPNPKDEIKTLFTNFLLFKLLYLLVNLVKILFFDISKKKKLKSLIL